MTEAKALSGIRFKMAGSILEYDDAKTLFLQYAQSLDTDLSFQDFSNEIRTISKQYNKPTGALLLAFKDEIAIGCAGVRHLDNDTAELKRMFVRTEYRQFKIGRKLLEMAINIAKDLNYKSIRLDTLPTMTQAKELYRSNGFYEIPPYRFNPVSGTVFMEKKLD